MVTTCFTQLDVITQKNAALSDETREAAGAMQTQAAAMQTLIGRFRTSDGSTSDMGDAPSIAAE